MLKFEKQGQKSFKNLFSHSFSLIDAFGQPAPIKILKKDKYSTKFGQCMTIVLFLICLIQFGYAFSGALNYSNPSILIKQQLEGETEPITLLTSNFTFAVSFLDVNLYAQTNFQSYFMPIVQNCAVMRTGSTESGTLHINRFCNNYTLETCSIEKHFPTKIQQQAFAQKNLSQVFCINSDQWKRHPPVLQGTYQSASYQYLTLTVVPCQNTTTFNKCPSLQEIQKYINGMYYFYDRNDILSQLDNFEVPFQEIITNNIVSISMTQSQIIQEYLAISQVITDQGLILKDFEQSNAIGIGNNIINQNSYNDKYIFIHFIQFADKINIYQRNYQKIQTLLGQLGGLWQVMYFISQIMISPIITNFMNLQMANKLFDFETQPQDEVQCKSQRQIGGSIFRRKTIDMNIDLTDRESISKFMKSRKKSLNVTLRYVCQLMCGCRKDENVQLQYAAQKIYSKLDVSFILQKLMEIDKLKQIILTKEQCQLFNYLPKPTIPIQLFDKEKRQQLEDNPLYEIILQEEQSDESKLQNAFQIYMQMSQRQQTPIDIKLINLIDADIMRFFKQIEQRQVNLDLSIKQSPFESVSVLRNNQQEQIEIDHIVCQEDSIQRPR